MEKGGRSGARRTHLLLGSFSLFPSPASPWSSQHVVPPLLPPPSVTSPTPRVSPPPPHAAAKKPLPPPPPPAPLPRPTPELDCKEAPLPTPTLAQERGSRHHKSTDRPTNQKKGASEIPPGEFAPKLTNTSFGSTSFLFLSPFPHETHFAPSPPPPPSGAFFSSALDPKPTDPKNGGGGQGGLGHEKITGSLAKS